MGVETGAEVVAAVVADAVEHLKPPVVNVVHVVFEMQGERGVCLPGLSAAECRCRDLRGGFTACSGRRTLHPLRLTSYTNHPDESCWRTGNFGYSIY